MIGRRGLLAGGAAFLGQSAFAALPVPPGHRQAFQIWRNGSAIGEHELTFAAAGNRLTVHIEADIAIGLGPITLFRYRHRAVERWLNGQVVAVESKTDDDGTRAWMTAEREGTNLIVQAAGVQRYTAPAGAMPATHWNRRMLDGPMINTQTGALMRPRVTDLGPSTVPVAGGGTVRADHFTLRGDADLDTWYSAAPAWAGLRFTARDGSVVEYRHI